MLWLAFLLTCLLVGFGVTAFKLFVTNQEHQLYAQLQRRLSAVASDLSAQSRGGGGGPGRFKGSPPDRFAENRGGTTNSECVTGRDVDNSFTNRLNSDEPPGPSYRGKRKRPFHEHFDDFTSPPLPGEETPSGDFDSAPPEPGGERPGQNPPEKGRTRVDFPWGDRPDSPQAPQEQIRLSTEVLDLFDQSNSNSFYFVVWNRLGTERLRSSNAPPDLEVISSGARASGPQVRTHGDFLESHLQHVLGYRVLVGRSIAPELASRKHFAWWLIGAGGVIFSIGLFGSWWLAGRALLPIQKISNAASRISAGNLSERIDLAETDNELGQLATTLNSTFSRLEAAFTQQKQFTADASHELRTPLSVIISEAQTTLNRPRTESEYRETIVACLATAQQMRKLMESLLELARYDSGQESLHRTPFDLADLAGDGVGLLENVAAAHHIQLHTHLEAAPTSGDADRVRQVVINLISNAIYYNRPGGTVDIATKRHDTETVLTVTDNGLGIAEEDLPNIFKRFYRADKSRSRSNGNAGLGLSICKAIVDAHGGQLIVTSKLGAGTTFKLTLPAAA